MSEEIRAVGSAGALSGAWRQVYYASRVSAAYAAAVSLSRPETPVEPVRPVRRIAPDVPVRVAIPLPELPNEAELANASEQLARMRLRRYGEETFDSSLP